MWMVNDDNNYNRCSKCNLLWYGLNMENKVSFISGFTLTSIYTMTLYEFGMALLLGIIGGVGGVIGKEIYYYIKNKWK